MVPSPKVATYDKDPKMNAHGVAEKVAELLKKGEHEFIMCNFAPPDMVRIFCSFSAYLLCAEDFNKVGHTGIYDAAVEAISETDEAVGTIAKAAKEAGYVLAITADHGNAEQMINLETGAPHTAHTTNPVPFIVTGGVKLVSDDKADEGSEEQEPGALCDVAPTILAIMVCA